MILVFGIFLVALVMTIAGRGGGNFYVPLLVLSGMSMHRAAATGQCILFLTTVAASLVFHTHKTVDWRLLLLLQPSVSLPALAGGYSAHLLPGGGLKIVFAGLLVLTAFLMLRPSEEILANTNRKQFGFWHRQFGDYEYVVNLWMVLPVGAAVGFIAGMVGISGGSFLDPLMVLACGVPMRVAVGTSNAMVSATALMGWIGHSAAGDFTASGIAPLIIAAVVGGLLGGMLSLRVQPVVLKKVFAYTTLAAAALMTVDAYMSRTGPGR
jgi:uncharacterized membrane protein YfcA